MAGQRQGQDPQSKSHGTLFQVDQVLRDDESLQQVDSLRERAGFQRAAAWHGRLNVSALTAQQLLQRLEDVGLCAQAQERGLAAAVHPHSPHLCAKEEAPVEDGPFRPWVPDPSRQEHLEAMLRGAATEQRKREAHLRDRQTGGGHPTRPSSPQRRPHHHSE